MAAPATIADFNHIINKQREAHRQLGEQLLHIREVLAFTLSSDLTAFKPAELQAQLISIDTLMQEAEKQNAALFADFSLLKISVDTP